MLGKEIKSLRERAKISIEELAFRSNISVAVLNRLEKGSIRHIPFSDLPLITDNLHI
jgi:transcriptional regulator with XRE-family HTH domain